LNIRTLAWLACLLIAPDALAQAWPTKPIHFFVPFAPGGPGRHRRAAADAEVGDMLGQQILIEYKPGRAATWARCRSRNPRRTATPR
jgi:tripartite-type tricarboxylate transporter receptor subunit TctC